jgi:hypothetical protein
MTFEVPDDAYGDDLISFLKEDSVFGKLFSKEQKEALIAIFKRLVNIEDYHGYKDTCPHEETLGKAINQLEAKFRNHRHETGKTFSAKPEY